MATDAARTELLPPELAQVPERRALTTSIPVLDRLLGGFEAGRLTLIDSGSDYVFHLTSLLCVRAVMEGGEVVFVDGGNSVDPHGIARIAGRAGLARLDVLPRVHVARAFTCHQMATILMEQLGGKVRDSGASLVVLSCLPELYLDEDVSLSEAHQLFLRSMRAVKRVVEDRDVVGVATNAGLAKLYRRKSIRRVLYETVDRAVRFQHHRGGLKITVPDLGVEEMYRPVPADQTTLEDFASAVPRITDLQEAVEPKEVKASGYLRFAW